MTIVAKIFQAISYWPIYLIFRFFVDFRVYGQKNLKGLENKPVIFASNHASYLDGPICAASMPRYKSKFCPWGFFPIRFLVIDRFFKPKYLLAAFYVWINGSIKISLDKKGDLAAVLKDTIRALEKNSHIWIYPEGKITKDSQIKRGKRGVAYLHKQTGTTIVPVFIKGTFKILSFKTLLRKKKVRVVIGQPIHSLGDVSLEQGVDKVMSKIADLSQNKLLNGNK